jgi:hypothetical protein
MPITWAFDTNGVAVITLTSPYAFPEWQRAVDDMLAAARTPPLRILVDRRAADPPDTEMLDQMVGYLRAHAAQLAGSIAAIVVSSEVAFGVSRMLEIRAEVARVPMTIKIFLDYDAATRWLTTVDPT